ncbi:hypothetical protein JIQ42_02839 [Leishmania sp. Namibia]|uniref:hypothetical protein n=1 Tax=Leishmania sp. Namibia TaxID=2802991 RepID=UPI001B6BF572|nr:hypothetical protein JIQ42_02839 [Leishmania sp. Namibia]
MGIACARDEGVAASSSVTHFDPRRRGRHVRKTRRRRNSSKVASVGHTSGMYSRADACTRCEDLSEALCALGPVTVPIAQPMKGKPLQMGAEKPSPKPTYRRDSSVQATAPITGTPPALQYPIYRISDDENTAGYAVMPFKSTYCLQHTKDVEPDSFRAMLTRSHAATAKHLSAPTAASNPKGDDGGKKRDTTSENAALRSELAVASRALSRPSVGGRLRRCFSCGIISDSDDDGVSRQADKVSFTSILQSGLVLQPESPPDSVSGEEASSIFAKTTNGTETDESSSTALTSQTTLSRRHTFGVMMPTGYSQVVEHAEDGGAWESAAASFRASPAARHAWPKQKSTVIASSSTEKEEERAVLGAHERYHYGPYLDRHRQRVRGTAAVPPGAPSRYRSKVGRQWPQPLMEGPKSNLSRSRPFNVEATLGCSVQSARFVPSPDWERVDVMEKEQLRLARSLKAYQKRLAEWERAQVVHLQTLSL